MPQALTDEQRQFAAENHNLIYKYLWDRRLEIDDYYDIAVFGYLRAVKRYLTEPWLHRYQFSTVAWYAMRQNIASFHRAEERRKETEQKYLKTLRTSPPDPFEELKAKLLLHDLAAVSSKEQYALASILLELAHNRAASKNFSHETQKLLYQIKAHPATRSRYTRCCEYLHRFYTEEKPPNMKYEEWVKRRLTEKQVLSYLRRTLRKQNRKPEWM